MYTSLHILSFHRKHSRPGSDVAINYLPCKHNRNWLGGFRTLV